MDSIRYNIIRESQTRDREARSGTSKTGSRENKCLCSVAGWLANRRRKKKKGNYKSVK